jgi:hypothetical protein
MQTLATLPRITRFLGTSDAGGPDAVCPHCGAKGRYVHPIAQADLVLSGRERELRQRFGPTAKLNTWDARIREAIEAFYAGTLDERSALVHIKCAEQAKRAWRRSRFGR